MDTPAGPIPDQAKAIEQAVIAYVAIRPKYVDLTAKLESLIGSLLRKHKISYHAIETRVKEVASFREKCSRPGKNYNDPMSQIADLAGLRIILYYQDDVDRVCALLDSHFDIHETVNKMATLADDQFGYLSIHKVARITTERGRLFDWDELKELQFEIQVRTIMQHAWAAISHALHYKSESDVPRSLRRRLMRLAGIIELADSEFMALRIAREEAVVSAHEKITTTNELVEVNSVTLEAWLATSKFAKDCIDIAAQQGLRVTSITIKSVSDLAMTCTALGLKSIGDVESALSDMSPHFRTGFGQMGSSWQCSHGYVIAYVLIARRATSTNAGLLIDTGEWHPYVLNAIFEAWGVELRVPE